MTGAPASPPDATSPAVGYARRLTAFDATMLVIGGIIGSGIFLNPAVVAQRVGTPALTIGVWALGGAVALAGAFCFAELGARLPQAGGGYVYLREAFGPLPAFLYGWTQLLVINSGGIAAVSVTFANYANALVGREGAPAQPLAIGAIVVLSAVNYFGIRPGSAVQNTFTILKLAALGALIVAGLSLAGAGTGAPPAGPRGPAGAGATLAVVGAALIPVLFAYGGWQSTNFVAGEMRQPTRDLPRALLIGVGVVVAVYLLANIVYVRVLGVPALAASTAPASDVMRRLLGSTGAALIGLGIVISTFGFLNLAILAAPRMYQAMAADGVFFGRVADLHPTFRVPAAALLLQAGWAILLVVSRTYGQLLDFVVFGDWIFFGLTAATLFAFRRRPHAATGGFRLPGYPLVPAFFVAVAVFTVASTILWNPVNAVVGAALIAAGIPLFIWWRARGVPEPPS